jgi:subtilisin family serine protease
MVKINFVNSVGAFNAAVALNPDIISCSWGSSVPNPPLSAANQIMASAVANAVSNGITVVFSAGNGQWGFPGQHPDVISAGGVYMREDGTFEATPYASGFASNVYPGRNVPDCCGLVGLPPRAMYIMLPVEPGDEADMDRSGGTHPNGDETAADDGWAAFSGTSAAAPQLAGVCALMKQACHKLEPAIIKQIIMKTSRDVTSGNCNPSTGGHPATPGVDLATGHGLVDASAATITAWLRCFIVIPHPPIPPIIPSTTESIPSIPPQPIPAQASAEQKMAELEDLLIESMRQ